MSMYVPLMTETEVSHNSRIPASKDNLALSGQADGNGNMSLALSSLEPRSVLHSGMIDLGLSLDRRGPIPETVVK